MEGTLWPSETPLSAELSVKLSWAQKAAAEALPTDEGRSTINRGLKKDTRSKENATQWVVTV